MQSVTLQSIMKNILLLSALFISVIAGAQGFYGFKNSDFEGWANPTTFNDWTLAGGSISRIAHVKDGAYGAALKNEASSSGQLTMAFPFTARSPRFLFDYKFVSGSSTSTDTFEVTISLTRWVAGAREVMAMIIKRGNFSDGTWQTFSYPFSYFVPSGNPDSCFITVNASINKNYNTATVLNLDNFTLQAPVGVAQRGYSNIASGVYPNPVKDKATLTYDLKHDSKVTVSISDITGKIVREYVFNGKTGRNEEELNADGFKSGIYFYEIKSDSEIKTGKFTISR